MFSIFTYIMSRVKCTNVMNRRSRVGLPGPTKRRLRTNVQRHAYKSQLLPSRILKKRSRTEKKTVNVQMS